MPITKPQSAAESIFWGGGTCRLHFDKCSGVAYLPLSSRTAVIKKGLPRWR